MRKGCLVLTGIFFVILSISVLAALVGGLEGISLKEKVAVLRIEGPIIDSKDVIEELKSYSEDSSVKAIVIRVDSPGGAVAPSQEIYEEVRKTAGKKKVVASMGSIAASGGYYVALPASRIFANPGTLTGSIGVIMEIPNIERLMDKIGIKTQVIKSGRHKDMASVFRGMKEEERSLLQGLLDDVHEQFISAVAESRKMPIEDVKELADGRVFTGRQAKDLGLVDVLGNLEDAIDVSARLAGIKGEPEVITKKEKFSIIDALRGEIEGKLPELFPQIQLKYILSL